MQCIRCGSERTWKDGTTRLGGAVRRCRPLGQLPLTFPQSVDQLPPYEDYAMAGRTYRYMSDDPLSPFGFGLSYTLFAYG